MWVIWTRGARGKEQQCGNAIIPIRGPRICSAGTPILHSVLPHLGVKVEPAGLDAALLNHNERGHHRLLDVHRELVRVPAETE